MDNPPDDFTDLTDLQKQFEKTHGLAPDAVTTNDHLTNAVQALDDKIQYVPSPEDFARSLETPPPAPDFELLTKTVDVPFASSGTMTLEDAVPIGVREVQFGRDAPIEASIIGVVLFESTNEHLQLLRLPNGALVIGKLDPKGNFKVFEDSNHAQYVSRLTSRGNLSASTNTGSRVAVTYRDAPNAAKPGNAHILLAEATKRIDVGREQLEYERTKKVRRSRRLAQTAFAAVTIGVSLLPGGLADAAMDPFIRAEQVVAGAEAQIGASPETVVASATVERLLDSLDNNDSTVVEKAADAYLEQHPDALIDPETLQHALEQIQAADTVAELEAALVPLETYYGYKVNVSPNAPFDAAKYTTSEVMSALGTIPKALLDDALLTEITIGSEAEIDEPGNPRNGFYRVGEGEIHMKASTEFDEKKSGITTPVGLDNGYIVRETFIHEFAHAYDHGNVSVVSTNWEQVTGMSDDNEQHDMFVGGILGNPSVISNYARKNGTENIAENMSGLLSLRRDGLAWPDNSRAFRSEANQAMVANLIELEQEYPGISALILSNRFADRIDAK